MVVRGVELHSKQILHTWSGSYFWSFQLYNFMRVRTASANMWNGEIVSPHFACVFVCVHSAQRTAGANGTPMATVMVCKPKTLFQPNKVIQSEVDIMNMSIGISNLNINAMCGLCVCVCLFVVALHLVVVVFCHKSQCLSHSWKLIN